MFCIVFLFHIFYLFMFYVLVLESNILLSRPRQLVFARTLYEDFPKDKKV